MVKEDPVCSWNVPLESASDTDAPIVDLIFREDLKVDDVVDLGDGIQSGSTDATGRGVARTSGINPISESPACLVAMDIGNGSRLDVQVGLTAEPCDIADQLVEIIDPKLPQG